MKLKIALFVIPSIILILVLAAAIGYQVTGAATTTCTDSDGGLNFAVLGRTIGLKYTGTDITDATDICIDGKLAENYCSSSNRVYWYKNAPQDCSSLIPGTTCQTVTENGVTGGACKPITASQPPQQITCSDLDGGKNYNTKGTTTGKSYNDPDKQITVTDRCLSDGKLIEHYCSSNSIVLETQPYTCPSGTSCRDGACITTSSTPPPSSAPQQTGCTDSDNSKDPMIRGDIKINGIWKQADYCKDASGKVVTSTPANSGKLTEFYCEGINYKTKEYVLGIESEGTKDMKCENGRLLKVITQTVPQQLGGSTAAGDVVVNVDRPVPTIGSGWGSCIKNKGGVTAGQQWTSWQVAGTKDQIEKICKDKGYLGLSSEEMLPCQHSNVNQRWNWDGSTAGSGSALVAVKCSSSTRSDSIGCSDVSDRGIDIYALGSCTGAGAPGTDTCVNRQYVREYYCSGGLCSSVVKPCTKSGYICSNGWCVPDPKGKCTGTPIPCSQFNFKEDNCKKQLGCRVTWTGTILLGSAGVGMGDMICQGTVTSCNSRTSSTCGTDQTTGCHWVAS